LEVHELEEWWATVQESIASRGLFIFRRLPLADTRVRSTLTVAWPQEQDAESFLDLAQALGVRLIYTEAFHAPEANANDPEVAPTLSGPLDSAGIAWVFEGVLHLCQNRTGRLDDERQQAEQSWRDTEANVRQLSERLAQEPDFEHVRGGDLGRMRMAKQMFPGYKRYSLSVIVREAMVILQNDIMPQREEALAEQARALLATGMNKTQAAIQLDLNRDRMSRILARSKKK
jgi:hypothetical protein